MYTRLSGRVLGAETRERELVEAFSGRRVDGLVTVPSDALVGPLEIERRNGTMVDGQRIAHDYHLQPDEIIRIDNSQLAFVHDL